MSLCGTASLCCLSHSTDAYCPKATCHQRVKCDLSHGALNSLKASIPVFVVKTRDGGGTCFTMNARNDKYGGPDVIGFG